MTAPIRYGGETFCLIRWRTEPTWTMWFPDRANARRWLRSVVGDRYQIRLDPAGDMGELYDDDQGEAFFEIREDI